MSKKDFDQILVDAAYDEVYGEDAHNTASDEEILAFMHRNLDAIQEAEDLIPSMVEEALKQTGPYDPEPIEVFLMSAPQHIKHKLVK